MSKVKSSNVVPMIVLVGGMFLLIYMSHQEAEMIKEIRDETYKNDGSCDFRFPFLECSYKKIKIIKNSSMFSGES